MSALLHAFQGKRVFLTGHTGFKGSWLCEWLLALGAEVHGYALDPQPHEILYNQLALGTRIASDTRKDLSDLNALRSALDAANPHFVLHLAAQPLVRLSYEIPLETFATNVLGTANVLESIRLRGKPCSVVCVTTDKCYENREWLHAYREEDPMGGHDPYSASKGAAELIISSYRDSFFAQESGDRNQGAGIRIASARAGNVIGGGDWATDRIVPDCIRAIRAGKPISVRNSIATRPWQHVLEPLSGYLWLAASLAQPGTHPVSELCSAFNFGPALTSNRTVAELVAELLSHTGGEWTDASDPNAPHEASKLNLATEKAFHLLGWQPVWNFEETVAKTAEWYLGADGSDEAIYLTGAKIAQYHADARAMQLPWVMPLEI
jgi:CDP-glucose 4,6-dehydratase